MTNDFDLCLPVGDSMLSSELSSCSSAFGVIRLRFPAFDLVVHTLDFYIFSKIVLCPRAERRQSSSSF